MKIDVDDAVNHIINSLENTAADAWYDEENNVTWHICTDYTGPGGIEFAFVDENGDTTTQLFRLTEV